MKGRHLFLLVLIFSVSLPSISQKIIYSEKDNDDTRNLNFEIVGKVGGNFLIYKNIRNRNWIAVLDNDMQQIAKVEQDYVPDKDRMINVDFFPYSDFAWMVYQYQRKNIIYCMATKIDGNGNRVGELMELDTTHIGFANNNKIYSVLGSEDKNRIIVFKINSRNRNLFWMTTVLMNEKLELIRKSRISIPMEERNDYLGDFHLDNEGDLVFSKFMRAGNDNISNAAFVVKHAQSDSLV